MLRPICTFTHYVTIVSGLHVDYNEARLDVISSWCPRKASPSNAISIVWERLITKHILTNKAWHTHNDVRCVSFCTCITDCMSIEVYISCIIACHSQNFNHVKVINYAENV